MPDQWMIRAREFSNCNCSFGCPCQFLAPSTYGFCEAVVSIMIDEGYFNDTRLDGVNFVMLCHWPGEIKEGNGKQQVIIDESASPEQREAVRKISYGESTAPGSTHFFVFNSLTSEVMDTLYAPIEMDIDIKARRGRTHIEGMVDSKGSPLVNPFNGKETRRVIHNPDGFEFTDAEIGAGHSKASAGIQLDLDNTYGHFCILHMNQDGVIR